MRKHNIVIDASAILAWVQDEEGADKIDRLLYDTDISRWIHGVNLTELQYRLLMLHGNYEAVQKLLDKLLTIGVKFDYTFDSEFTKLAATYRERIKSAELRISLADCFGMAATQLKKREGRIKFLTTDEGEFDGAKKAGLLPVEVDIIHQPSKRPTAKEEKPPVKRRKERKQ